MVKFPFKLQLKFFSFVVKIPQLCEKDISHKKKNLRKTSLQFLILLMEKITLTEHKTLC